MQSLIFIRQRLMGDLKKYYEVWSKRPIAPAGAPFNDKVKLRLEKFIRSLTPVGSLTARRGNVRNRTEKFIPLFGNWVRHGLAGGNLRKDLLKFRQAKGYQTDVIDLELDEMIQSGDVMGFFQESIATGRYATVDNMIDRLRKFKSPLVYAWKTMRRMDKILFLGQLSPEDRREFIRQIRGI